MATPYYTSTDLLNAVKRKISFPISQNTFSDVDLLAFANEEMMISQVPSVMIYHQEYFVAYEKVPLRQNVARYPIPDRAIGQRLRDVFWSDNQIQIGSDYGNLFDMTRISPEDKAYFQRTSATNNSVEKYFLEGNDVVITPFSSSQPTGFLIMFYFLRPNQLVTMDRAAFISNFQQLLTITDNTNITPGVSVVSINDIIFTPVTGSPATPYEFHIGTTEAETCTNLCTAINALGLDFTASNLNTNIATIVCNVKLQFSLVQNQDGSSVCYSIPTTQILGCNATIPQNIINGALIDFLETRSGHKTKGMNVKVPANGVSGTQLIFNTTDIPDNLVSGDYVCLAQECVIPQIPDDLHTVLAERTCSRILAAIGDTAGLQVTAAKIQEMEGKQGTVLDNRSEGSLIKVFNKNSLLRLGKNSNFRRF